jgi:hypothetical protein
MPALVLTIMYIMNHICELGLCLNSNKLLHLYKSLTMWSFGGLITRYQRFQFRLHIRRHQLGNVLRFHDAHFCPECACPWFFFKTQSNILWASMLQHYRDITIWHSTVAGTHHQTFHVAKKYLFKWQGWKGSHNIEPEDSQGLRKVDTNSILTSMVADFHWSVQWSAHQQIHFRHKEEQLLMYPNLLVGSLEAGSCVFNLINWLQVRVMITSVKFQKKRLLLFPLERHTTWTVYFTLYNNQFSPKSHHVSRKHSIYITLVYWEQKIHHLHNHTHSDYDVHEDNICEVGTLVSNDKKLVSHILNSVAATLLYHTRVQKWDVRVDGLILEVSVWHPHQGILAVEFPHCMRLP